MWRLLQATVFLVLAMAAVPAFAWRASLPYDASWGASLPLLDPLGGGSIEPIGFVHLPISGGYVFLSVQSIDGTDHVVVTRFHADGTLNRYWKDVRDDVYVIVGSLPLDLPVPDIDADGFLNARLDVQVQGSDERIFLAEVVGGGKSLRISRFDPDVNTLDSDAVSPSSMAGFGSLEAMTTGALVGASGAGAVVALKGVGTESVVSQFFGASGSPLTITGAGSHFSPGFRINAMSARTDGNIDVVGTEGGQALYLTVKTQKPAAVLSENFFDLTCPDGSAATSSTLDALTYAPPAYSDDATLVLGRADCGTSGRVTMVERVSNIRYRASSRVAAYSEIDASNGCPGSFSDSACFSYLSMSDIAAATAIALAPAGDVIHLDASSMSPRVLGDDVNAKSPLVVPNSITGASMEYPYLVGLSLDAHGNPGIARIAIDRIFADGTGDTGP